MTLIPYDPFRQIANARRDLDRLFSVFPHDITNENFGNIKVNVHQTENEVVVTCDIPGLEKKEDLQISIENNMVNLSGSINKTNVVKEENMYRKERYSGSFHRSITLPGPVSNEGVNATYKNGVLEIKMPKLTKNNKNKINVDFH